MKPLILNIERTKDKKFFSVLVKNKKARIVDEIGEQIKEVELVKNPKLLFHPEKLNLNKKYGTVWIYYPWRNTLVHSLNEKDFRLLRTSRNKNLITDSEQKKMEKFRVGIAGLNVGNPGAVCLALEGNIAMKMADNDVLSVSNLNRFRAGMCDIGLNKAVLTARQIWEINPFAKLEVFESGITKENIAEFLLKPKIDILVEEMDHLGFKVAIRELARKNGIPVVMVTGNGENVIIDVERFDLNPRLPLLAGYLRKDIIEAIKNGPTSLRGKIELSRDFMGVKYLRPRLVSSFSLVGTKLAGIPQIAESSFLRGAAISYVVRQIAVGAKVPSGRYYLCLDDALR